MKLVRILLLVLLSALLPVRGVMAAALLCPPHADAMGEAAHVSGDVHDDEAPALSGHHHDDAASGTDTCNLCSACCSVPPLPSAAPAVPLPQGTATTVFPSFAAPAPTFQAEGPERPPRSI